VHFNALPILALVLAFATVLTVQNGGRRDAGQIVGQHLFCRAMLLVRAIITICNKFTFINISQSQMGMPIH
jgi:hypothetical protein